MTIVPPVFVPLGFKSNSIHGFNPSLWSQRIGRRANIFQQLLKSLLIELPVVIALPFSEKLNRISAAKPTLNQITGIVWFKPSCNICQ